MIGVGTFKISEKAKRYVNEVLASERLSYGPFTQKFERAFAASHQCRFAVMTASGTCSLLIALAALKNKYKWNDGDEVIVPAVTFIATSNIVLQLNMKPVFVDVDPVFYEIDPTKIEAAITSKTRCIIPVHLFGCPCDMEQIMAIAIKNGLRVIEDSCETMFTKLNGKSVGSFGDIGCFSTYMAHIITTGVGGLCTTNDPDLAVNIRSLMNHGRDAIYTNIDDDKNKMQDELEMIIKRRFSFVQMGYSFRVTEMEGALGLAEFENREEIMTKRLANGHFFMDKLSKHKDLLQLPTLRPGAGHAFMMFPIVLKNEPKNELVNYLERSGIETREMLPLINQPFYKELFKINENDLPVAKWINENGFYIASHQGLSEVEKEHILETFDSYFAKRALQLEKACLILMSKGTGRYSELIFDLLPVDLFDELVLIEASDDMEVPGFFSKKGFKIIHEKAGKGALLKKAVDATTCENIVVLGLDGSDDIKDIDALLIKLRQGYDLVIGSRFLPGGGRLALRPFSYRSIGNRFFTFLLSVIFKSNITDCNNLFRAFKKSAFSRLKLKEQGESIMFEMTVSTLESGMKFFECPTVEKESFAKRVRRNRFFSALSFMKVLAQHMLVHFLGKDQKRLSRLARSHHE